MDQPKAGESTWFDLTDESDVDDSEQIRKELDERDRRRKLDEGIAEESPKSKKSTGRSNSSNYSRPRDGLLNSSRHSLSSGHNPSRFKSCIKSRNPSAKLAADPVPPTETFTMVDSELIFDRRFDIYYTDPTAMNRRKGISKAVYSDNTSHCGSFSTLSELVKFQNSINWEMIPDGCVIAYCDEGVKPIWEDPINTNGGRFIFRNFSISNMQHVFTKIAMAFLTGLLTDRDNYSLISLNVRGNVRTSDIQLWRKGVDVCKSKNGYYDLKCEDVANDLRTILGSDIRRDVTVSWMANNGSLSNNDAKMHGKQRRGRRDDMGEPMHLDVDRVFGGSRKTWALPTSIRLQLQRAEQSLVEECTPKAKLIPPSKELVTEHANEQGSAWVTPKKSTKSVKEDHIHVTAEPMSRIGHPRKFNYSVISKAMDEP